MPMLSKRSLTACCAVLTLAAGSLPTAYAANAGIWQEHRYSFAFLGFTSTYSCDGLAEKLKLLLLAAGARADAESRAGGCASGFGRPDKFARAELVFNTLTPVSGPVGAGSTSVPAVWQPVAMSSRHPRELQSGDCELVEQFEKSVLPMFTTRDLRSNTTCIPHQNSGSDINLQFDTFAAAQQPKDKSALQK